MPANRPNRDETTLYTLDDLLDRYSISRATLYRWMDEQGFPIGIKFSTSVRRWTREEVLEFEEGLRAA